MSQISKTKEQLPQISHLRNESKRQKIDNGYQDKIRILAKRIRDKDFWEYESVNSESSSDESNSNQFSTDESESEEESYLRNIELG